MSEVIIPEAERAAVQAPMDRRKMILSVAQSIVVNGVLPFVTYKVLAPYYPDGSILPLLYASVFPVLGLGVGLVKTRSIDAIAIFALIGIAYGIATMLIAGEVHLALILGATQGFFLALAFFVSTRMEKPIMFFMVRQFVAGNDPAARLHFAALDRADETRALQLATLVWAVALTVLSAIALALAYALEPATYLLANNIVNTAANIGLAGWTMGYVQPRLTRAGEKLAPAA